MWAAFYYLPNEHFCLQTGCESNATWNDWLSNAKEFYIFLFKETHNFQTITMS